MATKKKPTKKAATKKAATKKATTKKTAKKAAPMKKGAKKMWPSMTVAIVDGKEQIYLSGGNPQIEKGDGDEVVQRYIRAMPEWKRDVGIWLDALITKALPDVRKAVKWNSPFYGAAGAGRKDWFFSFHVFNKYVKVTFLNGASLDPKPPGGSKHPKVRYLDIHETDARDDAQMTAWIKQGALLPGDTLA